MQPTPGRGLPCADGHRTTPRRRLLVRPATDRAARARVRGHRHDLRRLCRADPTQARPPGRRDLERELRGRARDGDRRARRRSRRHRRPDREDRVRCSAVAAPGKRRRDLHGDRDGGPDPGPAPPALGGRDPVDPAVQPLARLGTGRVDPDPLLAIRPRRAGPTGRHLGGLAVPPGGPEERPARLGVDGHAGVDRDHLVDGVVDRRHVLPAVLVRAVLVRPAAERERLGPAPTAERLAVPRRRLRRRGLPARRAAVRGPGQAAGDGLAAGARRPWGEGGRRPRGRRP